MGSLILNKKDKNNDGKFILNLMSNLKYLDIRDNKIISIENIMEVLINFSSLSILYMQNSTSDHQTNEISNYFDDVQKQLRKLSYLDGRNCFFSQTAPSLSLSLPFSSNFE